MEIVIPEFVRLRCEGLENPIGLDQKNPLFSWVLENNGFDQSQSAYRVLVATNPEFLLHDNADIWDSGKVASTQSVHVKFDGEPLKSLYRYWWVVRIWDKDDVASEWSPPQHFEMGILGETDWGVAEWISLKEDTRKSQFRFREKQTGRMKEPEKVSSFPTSYFRKNISIGKPIKFARAYVCALGYYELYINGVNVGEHLLDPAPTTNPKLSLYVSHDITSLLEQNSTLGLILGNGFYGQNLAFMSDLSYGKPAIRLLIVVECEDETVVNYVSDRSWKVSTGPIVFDNVYGGETFDARFSQPSWSSGEFDDKDWPPAEAVQPEISRVAAQLLPPSKRKKVLDPIDVFLAANGNWIVDFGLLIAGWVRIFPKGTKGRVITIRSVEALTRTGDAIHPGSLGASATGWQQEDIYVCSGKDSGYWEPRFTYNSFRYVEIEGLQERPLKSDIQAILVHSDVCKSGCFNSSDPLLNSMVEVSERTVLNNLHGYPEDCPAREKCGWLGDAHVTAEFNLYSFDIGALFEKYAYDISTQLVPQKGEFSSKNRTFRVPTMIAPGKRHGITAKLDWGIAEIYLPWYVYLHTGNTRLIETHYSEMKELVEYYLTFKNENGVIQNGMGDWCPPLWDRRENPDAMECDPVVSANAYFFDILKIMTKIAILQRDEVFRISLEKEQIDLKAAFNKEYLQLIGDEEALWYGSQTGTVMALRFGLVGSSIEDRTIKGLLHDITKVKSGHHSTGIHGNRYIYTLLSDLGMQDLSSRLLSHPEFPSQAYIINAGMTTWPERQWEWTSGIEWNQSLNHPMQAGFAAFFYESLAGIRPDPDEPGFKQFIIKPSFLENLEFAGAEIESPYGTIVSKWKRLDKGIELDLEIPFNSKARVILPINRDQETSVFSAIYNAVEVPPNHGGGYWLGSGKYRLKFNSSVDG